MTTYSTEYLTDWYRLADLTTQLEAVRDGAEQRHGRHIDAFLAFADDWAVLVADA